MKKLLFISLIIAGLSCSKNAERCYECKSASNTSYYDAGCYTKEEWEDLQLTDQNGTLLDKDRDCRKK